MYSNVEVDTINNTIYKKHEPSWIWVLLCIIMQNQCSILQNDCKIVCCLCNSGSQISWWCTKISRLSTNHTISYHRWWYAKALHHTNHVRTIHTARYWCTQTILPWCATTPLVHSHTVIAHTLFTQVRWVAQLTTSNLVSWRARAFTNLAKLGPKRRRYSTTNFPSGPPPQYWTGPSSLTSQFGMGCGVNLMVWPYR